MPSYKVPFVVVLRSVGGSMNVDAPTPAAAKDAVYHESTDVLLEHADGTEADVEICEDDIKEIDPWAQT